ncbi:glycine zipper 2TM domain-containing protein [Sphingomonas quercus]|uniref:17 kDa surface antigen n=1 Tax=Sphingomonas quercus TaxID=2842451 RepID=A0ABS6BLH2_9SPHN|nr:glycine zipper 2TM domain-containing protein [Sphingomonas quercus]MBU3079143.1 glycine zipper 2TM domain-containing protein [Sphingomonas quercus]
MFRKTILGIAAAAATLGGIVPAAAIAAPRHYDRHYARGHYDHGRHYAGRGYYRDYRGGRCYDKGNGGLAIGGIAGGLLGNTVAGHGDKTLGTVLGAAGGALVGRAIDKSDGRRC